MHTDDNMPPSLNDIINLANDSKKEGFFSIVATESKLYALVIEDKVKATKFFEENSGSIMDDGMNKYYELTMEKGMSENNAQKDSVLHVLKDSGIGLYEANNNSDVNFTKVKSKLD